MNVDKTTGKGGMMAVVYSATSEYLAVLAVRGKAEGSVL